MVVGSQFGRTTERRGGRDVDPLVPETRAEVETAPVLGLAVETLGVGRLLGRESLACDEPRHERHGEGVVLVVGREGRHDVTIGGVVGVGLQVGVGVLGASPRGRVLRYRCLMWHTSTIATRRDHATAQLKPRRTNTAPGLTTGKPHPFGWGCRGLPPDPFSVCVLRVDLHGVFHDLISPVNDSLAQFFVVVGLPCPNFGDGHVDLGDVVIVSVVLPVIVQGTDDKHVAENDPVRDPRGEYVRFHALNE